MEIKVNNLSYSLDDTGTTTNISVGLNGQDGASYFNSTVNITAEDLTDGVTFDDLTKKSITEIALAKLKGFVG